MLREYSNNVNASQDSWFASDPFYYVRIDAINHASGGIQKLGYTSFAPSSANHSTTKESANNFTWIYQTENKAGSTINFTASITVPATGYYLIENMVTNNPKATGNFIFTIDGTAIKTWSGHFTWDNYGVIERMPIQYLTAGTHTMVLTVPKYCKAGWFKIMQLTRYEGGKEVDNASQNRLDLISCQFTQNGINQLDTCDITIAMKDDYWKDNRGQNPLCFDFGDHITISLGQDMMTSRPMFGGYVVGWELADDNSTLTLKCVDRLLDLKRTMIWRNFSIGYLPKNDGSGTMPFTQFPNINSIAQYLCHALYRIDESAIVTDHITVNHFDTAASVSGLTSSGFQKAWETTFGHPGTCMKLIPTVPGMANSVTLYSDPMGAWDASYWNMLNIDYYTSGAGVKYPIRFNLEIDMFKEGETVANKVTYVLQFNGPTPSGSKKSIGSMKPTLNGTWQPMTIDLNAAFNKYAPSSSYNITAIRLVGAQTNRTILNRRQSALWIDNFNGYKQANQTPRYASADTKDAYDELLQLCDSTNNIAFNRPGMERSQDQLIMLPKQFFTLPLTIDDSNTITVTGLQYLPLDWGYINWAVDTFNYSQTKSGKETYIDDDSEMHYGPFMDHEFFDTVTTLAGAQSLSKAKVNAVSQPNMAFAVNMIGSTLLEPGQNVSVIQPKYKINGSYQIMDIIHNIDFINQLFATQIDFTRPSYRFSKMAKRLRVLEYDLKSQRNMGLYQYLGNNAAGLESSLGAYV